MHSLHICRYYLLGGATAAPSGLYARLFHAFLVHVDELVLHKNNQAIKNHYFHTALNNTTSMSTKYYQKWLMNVEDIASQSRVVFQYD